MSFKEFQQLMQTVAEGWNEGNPAKSVECFTDNATYIEPPDKQFFQGKSQLYPYFGGDNAQPGIMKLQWHHLFFNKEKQIGSGEYTFEMNNIIHHGVAIVELDNGKIKSWREYDMTSSLTYDKFISSEGKDFQFTIEELKVL